MTHQEALDFINFNNKELGLYEDLDLDKMTKEEVIKFAENENARAEAYYEYQ